MIAKLSEALVIQKNLPAHDDLPPDIKVIDAESLGISVPPVYWWLGKKTDKSTHVLLRFSTTCEYHSPNISDLNYSLVVL